MDSPAGFDDDDDEDFFRRYDAERASQSNSDLDSESAEPPPPSAEQLAHFGRFRKPVAYVFAAMTVLSLTALALRGSEPIVPAPTAQRQLVAHYAAALPAAPPAARAAPVVRYEPVTWGMVSPAPSMCLLDASADSAWLTVALAEPPSFEDGEFESTAFRPSHASSLRGRRPAHASSMGAHVAANAHLAPSSARATPAVVSPVASAPAAPPLRSVARFPDPR